LNSFFKYFLSICNLHFRIVCSVHVSIYWLNYFYFWVLHKFWILITWHLISGWHILPFCRINLLVYCLFSVKKISIHVNSLFRGLLIVYTGVLSFAYVLEGFPYTFL
jgi:hypothetical protein